MIQNMKTVKNKLWELSASFHNYVRQKEWGKAKYCYDTARTVALFMELSEQELIELFGSREVPDKPIQGLFPEEYVQRAYLECIKKNQTSETENTSNKKVHGWEPCTRAEAYKFLQIYYTLRPRKNQEKCG